MHGMVGVGTWETEAEFKDIRVTHDGKTLFDSNKPGSLDGMQTGRGDWRVNNGVIQQTSDETDARALFGDPMWSDYTLSLKARKVSGNEGFLILFAAPDATAKSWLNLGGWGNTQHGIESPGIAAERVPGKIETGRWYDIRIALKGNTVLAFLDGKLILRGKRTPPQMDFGHALIPDLIADPSVVEYDGVFYLYATTDGMGHGLATAGLPVVWKSKDFLHWHFDGSLFDPDFDAKYWAPSAAIHANGRYYLFPTLDNRITALVSDSPDGPFKTLDGKDITKTSGWRPMAINVGHPIDAELFKDDDGMWYMMWSQRYIAKMKPDFTGFVGESMPIQTKRGGYSEGPCMFKRKGIYYYLYTLGGSEGYQYAYMMSRESPMGPWVAPERDIIATSNTEAGVFGPGHGCFFNLKGTDDWYFIYLEYGRSGTNRDVLANRMTFNPDGTIKPIKLSLNGVGALMPDPAYNTPNLAEGKQATASSTRSDMRIPPINYPGLNRVEGFAPTNAIDGSNGSRWMAREDDDQPWYQIDFGRAMDIKRTELYFVKPTTGHAYQLEYSLDGKTWQAYGGHSDLQVRSPHTDKNHVRARYLRLTFLEGTPGLWEFAVY